MWMVKVDLPVASAALCPTLAQAAGSGGDWYDVLALGLGGGAGSKPHADWVYVCV